MTVHLAQATDMARPTVTPLKSSVLDHASVKDVGGDFGKRRNAGVFPSYNCLDLLVPTQICPAPTADKVFDVAPWVPAFEFSVYGGVQCNPVGLDVADQKAETERVFRASEGKGIERALLANRFVERDLSTTEPLPYRAEWDAPVDLTPATPVNLPIALALLEGYAASVYSGQPTIHMSRAAASLLGSDKIVWEGNKAFTRNGAKVAMGGGYDSDTVPPSGEWDLYATGEVFVERGEEVSVMAYTIPGVAASGLDDNTHVTLVERSFRAGVDCFVARATGTVWA